MILRVSHWLSKLESFNERQWQKGEIDKRKEGKLLYSLMRALLPVWESLVMLGPGLGETGGREEGDETKEGHTGELTRVLPTQQEMSASPIFFLGQTQDDGSQVLEMGRRQTGGRTGWCNIYHGFFWKVANHFKIQTKLLLLLFIFWTIFYLATVISC